MPFRIQRVPRGLNNFLKFFGGQSPIAMEDLVRGSIDLTKFYEGDILVGGTSTPTVGALGGGGITESLTHTAMVELRALSCALTIGAAAATNVVLSIAVTWTAGTAVHLGSIYIANAAIGQICRFGVPLPKPLVMTEGTTVFAQASGTAAGADHSLAVQELIAFYPAG